MARRRKYQFPDRPSAEAAYRKASQAEILQLRLARALYQGAVAWCELRGSYRFGVFDWHSCDGPKIIKVFHPDCNNEPDLKVIDPYSSELRELEELALRVKDSESEDILAGIRAVREKLLR